MEVGLLMAVGIKFVAYLVTCAIGPDMPRLLAARHTGVPLRPDIESLPETGLDVGRNLVD